MTQYQNDKPIVMIGECMLELVHQDASTLKRGYAGDTFNASVYMKRAFAELNVNFMSCIGNDPVSDQFVELMNKEKLGQDFIEIDPSHHMGVYLVKTDENGERSFVYWRSDSAARRLMHNLTEQTKTHLHKAKLVFFSGISLAILNESQRLAFFDLLQSLKTAGVKLAFDPNYRPSLWASEEIARDAIQQAFEVADILLPGIEDFELFGLSTTQQILQFLQQAKFDELILKDGPNSVLAYTPSEHFEVEIVPNPKVVDTTSAGDSFAGIYLGARAKKISMRESIKLASIVAKEVTCHKGAIVPEAAFRPFWQNLATKIQ